MSRAAPCTNNAAGTGVAALSKDNLRQVLDWRNLVGAMDPTPVAHVRL